MSNSIKFTLEGHVIIKCKQLDNFIEFRIEDTGVGISNEDKQNLFKEFGMGKSQADLNKHGSGLGLCISKKIVEKMKMTKVRVYVAGQNLFTITKYSGNNPEVGLQKGWGDNENIQLNLGRDWGSYPVSKVFMFGVNASF